MKEFYLSNKDLVPVYNAVYSIPTKNSKINRSKFKLLSLIDKKIKEHEQDRKTILEKYAKKNEDGEPEKVENGGYKIEKENIETCGDEVIELGDEKVTIVYGEYASRVKDIMDYLDNYEGELDGDTGKGMYVLLEAYEQTKGDDE